MIPSHSVLHSRIDEKIENLPAWPLDRDVDTIEL